MGKTVTRVVGAALLVVGIAATGGLGAGAAAFLGVSSAGLGATVAGITAASFIVAGASTVASTFFQPSVGSGSGQAGFKPRAENLSIQTNSLAARSIGVGKHGLAGTLRFRGIREGSEETPDRLLTVLVLGGYPVASLDEIIFNGEVIDPATDLDSSGMVTSGKFANKLWFEFFDGSDTTHKFGTLIGGQVTVWNDENRRFRGSPVVGIRADIDEDFEGRFEPFFKMTGHKWYDPRSGTDDFADPSTWTGNSWNPALFWAAYLRGWFVNTVQIAGMDMPLTAINTTDLTAAANACEEQVNVVGGGTIDRYRANGVFVPSKSHRENLRQILSAMAGDSWGADQKWRVFAGVAQTVADNFAEGDIIGAPQNIRFTKNQDQVIKEIRGSFANATDNFQIQEYPPLDSGLSVGEQERFDLPLTTDHRVAQRIRKIALNRANAGLAWQANYSHKAIKVTGGEIVTQNYPRYRLSTQRMRIQEWTLSAVADNEGNPFGLGVNLDMVEDDTTWYDWDETTEEVSIGDSAELDDVDDRQNISSQVKALTGGLNNPGFEAGDTGWSKGTGWSIVNDSTNAADGSWVAKGEGSTVNAIVNNKKITVKEGDRVLAQMLAKKTAGAGSNRIAVEWLDINLGFLSNSVGDTGSSGTYQRLRVLAAAPASAAFAQIMNTPVGEDASSIFWCDQFEAGLIPKDVDIDALQTTNAPAESGANKLLNMVNNLADTDSAQDQAFTTPVSAFTAGPQSITDGLWNTVQTVSITATGRVIFINFALDGANAGSGTDSWSMRLLREDSGGGNQIDLATISAKDQRDKVGISQDMPGTGAFDYLLQFRRNVSDNFDVRDAQIMLQEIKK